MKPEIKTKWLAALRSGDYQQGQGYLRQGDQYCCLGVLCDLYGKETGAEWDEEEGDVHSMHASEVVLPVKIMIWAGLKDPSPLDLAAMNDNGSTFEELAKIIEEAL